MVTTGGRVDPVFVATNVLIQAAVVTAPLHEVAVERLARLGGKQVHDANIVAIMQASCLRRLLTHSTADFVRFEGLIVIEPLVVAP